jgi:hypothetical protein
VDEHAMLQRTQAALARAGVEDELVAAAVFLPRGHFGGAFAGGLIGDSLAPGGVAGAIATVGGAAAGSHAVDVASPVPERCFVGVSASKVYGFDSEREHGREPTQLVFAVAREGLGVKVHQRFNVRVLELIDGGSGTAIELEGPRLPGFHTGSVIDALQKEAPL